MAENIKDMTSGRPLKLLLSFAVPLMLGNVFQQMYTIADTAIVGQALGVNALASLGAADWLNWLVLGLIMGFTQGFSILIAQEFGANNRVGLHRAVTMSIIITMVMAVIITVITQLAVKPTLLLLNTPDVALEGALTYLRICYGGIVVIAGYNILSSILRALGDSRTPLIAMIIASVINITLDLVFVVGFHWGIAGAAAATVIGQAFSCLFCLWAIRRISVLDISKEDWKPERKVIGKLLILGTPMAFQNVIIAVGGLVVQSVINRYGVIFVAGYTATNKLYGLLELAATSFGFSMATYTGQNLGAKNYHRIRHGGRVGAGMAIVTSLIISAFMLLFGRYIVMLFISSGTEGATEAADIAYHYLAVMSCFLSILYLLYIYRSGLQGMGDTVIPMISGIIEFIMRVACVVFLPPIIGEYGIYFAEVSAWIGATLLLSSAYYWRVHKLIRNASQLSENPSESSIEI